MGELKQKTLKGVFWNTIQILCNRGLSFFFMIFMTRLLLPNDYGLVGMLAVFMEISKAFVDCGFGQAIVRKKDRTDLDEATVFYFNIAASAFCYLLLFIFAPFISAFYNMPDLTSILRVMGLTLVISSLSEMHILRYSIALNFKTPSLIVLGSQLASGLISLLLAYIGFGVWALVWQQVLASLFMTVAYLIFSKWRPIWGFSWQSFKEMFMFGSKLLGARLLNIIYHNISPIFIGRSYSATDLGLFTKSETMISFPCNTTYGVISMVTYPVLCKMQTDNEKMSFLYRKFIRYTAFSLFPVMVFLAVLSTPLVIALFGEAWTKSGTYMTLLALPWMLVPIQSLNLNLLQVVGRSDLIFRLEVLMKIFGVIMLFVTLPISITAMCYGTIFVTCLAFFANTFYTAKFINYSLMSQLADILRPLFLSIFVGIFVLMLSYYIDNCWLKVIVGSSIGMILYISIAYIFRMEELIDLQEVLKRKRINNIQ